MSEAPPGIWTGREAAAPSQEINPCQEPGSPGTIFIILRRDPEFAAKCQRQSSASLLGLSPLLGLLTPIHLDQRRLLLLPDLAVSDQLLAVTYRRKIGHIESWEDLPEEWCILGQLHVLPSVWLHNLKDVGGRINLRGRWDHRGVGKGEEGSGGVRKKSVISGGTFEEGEREGEEGGEYTFIILTLPTILCSATWMAARVGKSPNSPTWV